MLRTPAGVRLAVSTLTVLGAALTSSAAPRVGTRVQARLADHVATPAAPIATPAAAGNLASLVDLNLPPSPSTSVETLVARVVLLGADGAAARRFAGTLGALTEPPADDAVAALAAPLGLADELTPKVVRLAQAFVSHEPVELVGIQPSPEFLANVRGLMSNGIDPDVATWLARQELAAGGVPIEAGVLALEQAGRRELLDGLRTVGDLPGTNPIPLTGFCRTCPSVDVVMGTPTTSYQTTASSITAGSCKIYRFIGGANKRYRFTFCEGGGTANFDTTLDVMGANCGLLDTSDNNCALLSQVTVTNTAAGYMYVKVYSNVGAGGNYTLAYRELPVSPPGACNSCPTYDLGTYTPTATCQSVTTTVPDNGCKIVRFSVLVNHTYRFSACTCGGTANFDAALQTYTGTCGLGPFNDDFCGIPANRPQVDFVSNSSQYVYVKILANGTGGNITLGYQDTTNICPTCPVFNFGAFTPTPIWQTHSGSFLTGQCRVYKFNLTINHAYHFTLCNDGFNGASATFASMLTLLDGACTPVATQNQNQVCGIGSSIDNFIAPSTGPFYLIVSSAGAGGSYVLAYVDACKPQTECTVFLYGPDAPTATNQVEGPHVEPYNGCQYIRFINLGSERTYRFSLCTNGGSASFDSTLYLLNNTCTQVASGIPAGCVDDEEIQYSVPVGAGGTYTAEVANTTGTSGTYALEYQEICKQCPGASFDRVYPPIAAGGTFTSAGADYLDPNCTRLYFFTNGSSVTWEFSLCTCDGGFRATPGIHLDAFTAPGACAATGSATGGCATTIYTENFDGVTAPALPAGWTATGTGAGSDFVTATGTVDTAPNAAFISDASNTSDRVLSSPVITLAAAPNTLTFRNNWSFETGFDIGNLEISINGGPFTDIVTAGGAFVTNGYNSGVGGGSWTGDSGGFVTTTVILPPAAANQNIQLHWRARTDFDNSTCGTCAGWRVDTIGITGVTCARVRVTGQQNVVIRVSGTNPAVDFGNFTVVYRHM